MHLNQSTVHRRKKKINRITNEKLAKEIIKLIYTKHATIEQVKIIGDYYGVDMESVLELLEEKER